MEIILKLLSLNRKLERNLFMTYHMLCLFTVTLQGRHARNSYLIGSYILKVTSKDARTTSERFLMFLGGIEDVLWSSLLVLTL